MAPSSAKAICRAASLAGCQSESFAPRSTFVDRLTIQLERNTQLDQRLHLALPRHDALPRSRDRPQVAGADSRKAGATRPLYVDDAPSGKVALERPRCFLFDLGPCRIGNGGKFAMEVIHVGCLL